MRSISEKDLGRLPLNNILFTLKHKFLCCLMDVPMEFSLKERALLIQLEIEKAHILKIERETWWLKSHAIWLTQGDTNTNFFHKYASQQRNLNSIWELKCFFRVQICTQYDLEQEVVCYFGKIFSSSGNLDIGAHLHVVTIFPCFYFEGRRRINDSLII